MRCAVGLWLPTDGYAGLALSRDRKRPTMFLFFSNRLGCFGSLLVSAAITVILVLLLTR